MGKIATLAALAIDLVLGTDLDSQSPPEAKIQPDPVAPDAPVQIPTQGSCESERITPAKLPPEPSKPPARVKPPAVENERACGENCPKCQIPTPLAELGIATEYV